MTCCRAAGGGAGASAAPLPLPPAEALPAAKPDPGRKDAPLAVLDGPEGVGATVAAAATGASMPLTEMRPAGAATHDSGTRSGSGLSATDSTSALVYTVPAPLPCGGASGGKAHSSTSTLSPGAMRSMREGSTRKHDALCPAGALASLAACADAPLGAATAGGVACSGLAMTNGAAASGPAIDSVTVASNTPLLHTRTRWQCALRSAAS